MFSSVQFSSSPTVFNTCEEVPVLVNSTKWTEKLIKIIENADIYRCVAICVIMKNWKMGVGFRNLKVNTKRKKHSHSRDSERHSANRCKGRKILLQFPVYIAVTQDCCNNRERRPARLSLDESTDVNLFDTFSSPSSDGLPDEVSVETTEFLNGRDSWGCRRGA